MQKLKLKPDCTASDSTSAASYSQDLILSVPKKRIEAFDDVCDSSMLDAMEASSPHPKSKKDVTNESSLSETDVIYRTWMLKHPSALASFKQIANSAEGKKISLFLDYDGTLSPIVDDPDCAFMSRDMRAAVEKVAKYFPTAIISGRSCDKVYEFVGLTELYYAGSHGMDIRGPSSKPICDSPSGSRYEQGTKGHLYQPGHKFMLMIDQVFSLLVERTEKIKGAIVENNKFCVSVHYRNVDEESWTVVAECVDGVVQEFSRLRLTHGRKVLEIRPVINWDKGKAVTFLLDSLGLSDSDDVLALYVGDDRTDEDAFKVLKEGNRGYGIVVSAAAKDTDAVFSLRDPLEKSRASFFSPILGSSNKSLPAYTRHLRHKITFTVLAYYCASRKS